MKMYLSSTPQLFDDCGLHQDKRVVFEEFFHIFAKLALFRFSAQPSAVLNQLYIRIGGKFRSSSVQLAGAPMIGSVIQATSRQN